MYKWIDKLQGVFLINKFSKKDLHKIKKYAIIIKKQKYIRL